MKLTTSVLVSLLCGLIVAQQENNPPDSENTEVQSCMCNLIKDFSDLREKLRAVETRLKESENPILELKNKGETLQLKDISDAMEKCNAGRNP